MAGTKRASELTGDRVADELQDAVRESMPSIYTTNHLLPLDLPAQIVFMGSLSPGRYGVKSDKEQPVLRASRGRLRSWLARDVDIQYGKTAERVEQTDDSVTVHFKDGSSATGDILVGADGTHSSGALAFAPLDESQHANLNL